MDATQIVSGMNVVPVVVIDDDAKAVPLAECLLESGIRIIEVTLRTAAGIRAIERIAREVPDMIVGAGSIRRVEQVDAVREAGARFAVGPGSTGKLLRAVARVGLPFIPGAATPSEMLRLLQQGYRLQKFFPAEAAGGINYLKSIAGPLPDIQFMPTGGISVERAADYLALDNVAAVGGSWIAPQTLLAQNDFGEISRLAVDAAGLGM